MNFAERRAHGMYASGASVDATERHDENYVCIIFNFPNIPWRSERRGSTPFKGSRGYEKLTIVGLRFSSDR